MTNYYGYTRVSTARQGESGLGLESQKQSVEALAAKLGGTVTKWFKEIESGKNNERPQLARALAQAKRASATIICAKIDRLARNVRFLLSIVESGVDVLFCDLPTIPAGPTGKFILTQMAAVAELEAGLISQRTKEALRIVKETKPIPKRIRKMYPNGVPEDVAAEARKYAGLLGSARPGHWDGREHLRLAALERARAARAANRKSAYEDLLPLIKEMEESGHSLCEIARALNEQGHTTSRGSPFQPYNVGRVLGRY